MVAPAAVTKGGAAQAGAAPAQSPGVARSDAQSAPADSALQGGAAQAQAPSAPARPGVNGSGQSSTLQVKLDPTVMVGVRLGTVAPAAVADTLRVAGRVDFNEQTLARIGTTVAGRIIDVQASVGQRVRAGQSLATLNSAELSSAQLAYLKAVAQSRLLATAAERARQLFAADVISQAELQRRENAAEVARAEESGAADQLAVLGMSAQAVATLLASGSINSVKPVSSRITGTVVERMITAGQVVQAGETLFAVADLSRVWVVANIPEQQAALVQVGQTTEIEVPSLGRALRGRLVHVAAVVDPQTRTVLARCELENPGGELKPAMLANLLIRTAGSNELVIPSAAVVRENDRDHVYVQQSAGLFVLTPVALGPLADGDVRPVSAGLQKGQTIVVSGAFHLNNERRRQELQ